MMGYSLEEVLLDSRKLMSYVLKRPEISAKLSIFSLVYRKEYDPSYLSLDMVDNSLARKHSYLNVDPNRPTDYISVLSNTIPSWTLSLSEGDDSEEIFGKDFHNEKTGYRIPVMELITGVLKKVEEEQTKLNSPKFAFSVSMKFTSKADLDYRREYIVPEARETSDGIKTCWHIYPAKSGRIFVIEHPHSFNLYNDAVFYKM